MWKLYDELIERIPCDIFADQITIGLHWTTVRAGNYCGAAMTVAERSERGSLLNERRGQPLRHLASLSKSWDFVEAAVGVAAINAYYNNEQTWKRPRKGDLPWRILGGENAFDGYRQEVKGKKVAVVGHFRQLENYLTEAKTVSVLERRPVGDDLPDSACEYILPEQDYVFITGSALVNKTLPRLLQLSEKAKVILAGPSTPMTSILFTYGVDEMGGFLVRERNRIEDTVAIGAHKEFFACGERIRMIRRK